MRYSLLHINYRVTFLFLFVTGVQCQSDDASYKTWSHYRGDTGNTAYSALTEITPGNVSELQVAWTFRTGDAAEGNRSTIQCNPLIVNNLMFVTSPQLKLYALSPASGKEVWRFDPFSGGQATGVNRGVVYYASGDDHRIYYAAGPYLYCLNADNGALNPGFGTAGRIDLRQGLGREPSRLSVWATSPGVIYKDLLIQGTALGEGYDSAPGFIRAYNIHSGELVWTFHTIPQPGEFGYETWSEGAYWEVGGTNSWAGMSLDETRGIVYAPTGSPAFDFFGGNRKGDNLFGNCLLALDASTGRLVWHQQLVHHDVWDYDLPAPPNLLTVSIAGKKVDAVAQVTKMGMVFLFNRDTGEPLFAIEERPVPTSLLLDEALSATQPFPTKPPPFVRHQFSDDDITNISPEATAYVRDRLKGVHLGSIFNPPSIEGSIQIPGTRGGAEWGGAAVDPGKGIMYVNANEVPLLIRMAEIGIDGKQSMLSVGQRVYAVNNCTMCHGADRTGTENYPSLEGLGARMSRAALSQLLVSGKGQMPAFPNLSTAERDALIEFLIVPQQSTTQTDEVDTATVRRYGHDGWNLLTDAEGYYGIKPPWGTLNAIDLNEGKILWQIPLGEFPELTARGIPPTGTQNLGGPVVTASGLLFIGATKDEKFRAFDSETGKVLWEYTLPAAGYATPAVYAVNGKQFVVIACGGGGKVGSKSGDSYIAFALP
jgi:quinoprotein glucose dehydrogenase